jgi:hypothetical protein
MWFIVIDLRTVKRRLPKNCAAEFWPMLSTQRSLSCSLAGWIWPAICTVEISEDRANSRKPLSRKPRRPHPPAGYERRIQHISQLTEADIEALVLWKLLTRSRSSPANRYHTFCERGLAFEQAARGALEMPAFAKRYEAYHWT